MRRILTLSLLVLFINSNTELHELLRLPLLFEHFHELKQKSNDLSFVDFLVMHYRSNMSHDEHDSRLPFKDIAHACVSTTLTIYAPELVLMPSSFLKEVLHSSKYQEAFIPSPLSEIFQPPRLS